MKCLWFLPGRRLREIFCGIIWTTSYWVDPDPFELRGMFCRTLMLLVRYSMKCSSQPLFNRFWLKSHRDVRLRPLPKSCKMESNKSQIPDYSYCFQKVPQKSEKWWMHPPLHGPVQVNVHDENNRSTKPYLLCAPGATGVNQEAFFTGSSTATHAHVETWGGTGTELRLDFHFHPYHGCTSISN